MEILDRPINPARPVDKIRYRCLDNWDGGVFRFYAKRNGWGHLLSPKVREWAGIVGEEGIYHQITDPTPDDTETIDKVHSVLQTWIYFGLLAEFLGLNQVDDAEHRVYDETISSVNLHDECVMVVGDVQYLDGNRIAHLVAGVPPLLMNIPNVRARWSYLQDCLEGSFKLLSDNTRILDDDFRLSVAALGTTLAEALKRIMRNEDNPLYMKLWPEITMPWFAQVYGSGVFFTPRPMFGWCPSEIERFRTICVEVPTFYHMTLLKEPEPGSDHGSCSWSSCHVIRRNSITAERAHIHSDCVCDDVHTDTSALDDILLRSQTYPVMCFERSGDGEEQVTNFTLEPYDPNLPYVALSHVWSDGLGNWVENSLPTCQIGRLADLVSSLQCSVDQDENMTPYRFWIDTLCCPVEPSSKTVALGRMADVYRNALHVLVLDESLIKHSTEECDVAELLIRIFFMSPWIRRVWTLQEGAVTKSLYVQFKDRSLSVQSLMGMMDEIALQTPGLRTLIAVNLWTQFRQLRARRDKGEEAMRLDDLIGALQFRSVSVPSDEPLCAGTIMGLQSARLAQEPDHEKRVALFWKLIGRKFGGVPTSILFTSAETLSLPGWSWAPKYLSRQKTESLHLTGRLTIDDDDVPDQPLSSKLGIPTALGLKAVLSAWRLEPHPHKTRLPLDIWLGVNTNVEMGTMVRHGVTGKWHMIASMQSIVQWLMHPRAERIAMFAEHSQVRPLHEAISRGDCALIHDPRYDDIGGCLVRIEPFPIKGREKLWTKRKTPWKVLKAKRLEINANVINFNEEQQKLLNALHTLAKELAKDEVTTELLGYEEREGQAWEEMLVRARQMIQAAVAEAERDLPPGFAQFCDGMNLICQEDYWRIIPMLFSYTIIATDTPADQVWVID